MMYKNVFLQCGIEYNHGKIKCIKNINMSIYCIILNIGKLIKCYGILYRLLLLQCRN